MEIFYNQISNNPASDETQVINFEKDAEIRHAFFCRQNPIYEIIENIKPYEKMNTIAYELAMRTPEVIDALKSKVGAGDFKKHYWLDIKECISFEKSLCQVLEKGVYSSRDPFVFSDRRRGATMKIPFSYPTVDSPNMYKVLKIYFELDLTIPDEDIVSLMKEYETSLIEYKHRMNHASSLELEKEFLSSKIKYFKGKDTGDNAIERMIKETEYPNAKNSNLAERFYVYDMTQAKFSKNVIIEAVNLYRYYIVSINTKIPLEFNEENISLIQNCMTHVNRSTINKWIETVQHSIDKNLYKKYVSHYGS